MSTPATIKAALQAAITKANNTTGAGDTTVTGAVDSLIAGFGQGGGGGSNNFHVFPITLSSAYTGANAEHTILSGNEFVKEHYADEGFFVMWIPLGITTAAPSGTAMWGYHGNRKLAIAGNTTYGIFIRSTGESNNLAWTIEPGNLSVNNWNVSFKANSSGDVILYRSSAYTIPAGEYRLVLGLVE